MHESANILHNATRRSLILLDEVGRGTATYDGISIAWAIAQYLHDRVGAKTIFATHYHELTELAEQFTRVRNVHVEVREIEDDIIFTHRVVDGHSDHSFGIHVARMAGMPSEVITSSRQILKRLEDMHQGAEPVSVAVASAAAASLPVQPMLFTVQDDELQRRIRALDIENMTPLQALQALHELRKSIS
jgi:DNA mismatch repair protein MutS